MNSQQKIERILDLEHLAIVLIDHINQIEEPGVIVNHCIDDLNKNKLTSHDIEDWRKSIKT